MKRFLKYLLLCSVLASCAEIHTTKPGAVGVQRKQYALTFISSKQLEGTAAKSYATTLKEADKKNELNPDQAQTERVRAIAHRLIVETAVFRPDALNWKWDINVQKSKEVNAYCMPGGKIMVYTGLIDQLNPSDDELAAVMGHEISHALREHGREQQSEQIIAQVGLVGLAAYLSSSKNSNAIMQGAAISSAVFISLPHSRTDETEADEMGLELAARAGYDPASAITLWEKMAKLGGAKPPEYLSDHPTDAKRIADMKRLLPIVTPLYEEAKAKH
jgi:predicted Zn-dependent protease